MTKISRAELTMSRSLRALAIAQEHAPFMVSVRDADGRSFSTVAAGMVIAEGSVSFPLPWNSTLILLLARPGPEPIEIVHPSTAQPGISRLRIGRVGHVFEPACGALRRPPARLSPASRGEFASAADSRGDRSGERR